VCVNGACVGCVNGAACVPPGDACQTGSISCGSGSAACVVTGDVADGTTCEAGICCGGACAACNPPANALAECSGSACSFTCSAGFHLCGDSCVDTTTDSQACGAECTVCPAGSPCNDSQCTAVFTYGDSVAYAPCGADGRVSGDYLLGELVYIADDIQVTALGVIAGPTQPTSGVHGIVALYSNMGVLPSALLAYTASATIAPGNNVIPVIGGPSVVAGDYWIMVEYDATASMCGDDAANNSIAFVPVTYGTVPAAIADAAASSGPDLNYYVLGVQ
jgi:hypothetical protein